LKFLRTASTRRLIAGSFLSVALVVGGVAVAMGASGGGTPPPAKPLDAAIHDSLAAAKPTAITARIHFTNNLVASGALPTGSPLLTGADGRLWMADGRLRLELQSNAGDAQITFGNGNISIYDASTNTVYKAQVGTHDATGSGSADTTHGVPTTAEISSALTQLAQQASLSGADPTTQAGQPAYKVSLTPKHDAGLLGQAEVAWDAATGVPLHISIAAAGSSSPVLALDVTDITYGSVDASALAITAPAGAKVVDLGLLDHAGSPGSPGTSQTQGLTAVQAAVPFTLAAPDTLVGLPRTDVRLISDGKQPAALVTYGQSLGAIAVIERSAKAGSQADNPLAGLPSVSIGGATGHELPTALGTVITAERGGVSYTLIGSLPANAAEAALRAVLA
jgi:outer membrane lipoprotein-sorting protein